MSKVEQAGSCFKDGFSCSQAILSTYGSEFRLEREIALKIATGFGGGIGRLGKTCGVISGAVMVIGLKYGNFKKGDNQTKEKTYEHVREFINRFETLNGSIVCNELLDCDINTPEGLKNAINKKVFKTICPNLVRTASEILEEIL